MWNDIELSRFLNQSLGTSFITPWNIGQIPAHWIEMLVAARNLEADLNKAGMVK